MSALKPLSPEAKKTRTLTAYFYGRGQFSRRIVSLLDDGARPMVPTVASA
jgi:hypothetical protein